MGESGTGRPDFLRQLDDLNDAPGFGMPGIIAQQEAQEAARANQNTQSAAPTIKDPEDHYAPLNTSIQELGRSVASGFSRFDQELANLRQQYAQPVQQGQQQQQPQYDPDGLVVYKQIQGFESEIGNLKKENQQLGLTAIKALARAEYADYGSEHPEFKKGLSKADLDKAVTAIYNHDPRAAIQIDWKQHFDNTFQPAVRSETERLRLENEQLKKQLNGGRSQPPAQPLSPALSNPSRGSGGVPEAQDTARPAANGDGSNLRSFHKKGNFRQFGRDFRDLLANNGG